MNHPLPVNVYLPAGQFHFGGGDVRVHTLLGSCVAITMWHPIQRVGGICHYLLPVRGSHSGNEGVAPGMYAEEAMILFADALRRAHTLPREYIVKIAGGGNMFPDQIVPHGCLEGTCTSERRAGCQIVGCKNIWVARELLAAAGYTVAAENVGGEGSRKVILDLATGDVWVRRSAALASAFVVAA